MAWPTGADIQQRTGIALTLAAGEYSTSYGLNVTQMILDAIAEAAAFCHRDSRYGFDEAEVTETFDGYYVIQVAHPPIIEVDSLTWDDEELDEDDDFVVYDRYIKILGPSRAGYEQFEPVDIDEKAISVTYTGGYSDTAGVGHTAIPRELKAIITEMVVRELMRIHERYREMKGVTQAAIGVSSYTFKSDNTLLSDLYARLARGPWEVSTVA